MMINNWMRSISCSLVVDLNVERAVPSLLNSQIELVLNFVVVRFVDSDEQAAWDLAPIEYLVDLFLGVSRDFLEGALHVVVAEVSFEDLARSFV